MSLYTVQLLYHEEKEETYTLTVDADDADSAQENVEAYLERPHCHPGDLPGRCAGVRACMMEGTEKGDTYIRLLDVAPLPDAPDPNQLALL